MPERDGVERGLVQVAKLEIREAEEVADARCREHQPADLSRSQGDWVARKDPRGEMEPAVSVDPAVERRDEVLPAARAIARREDEPRSGLAGRRRELVRGPHDVPEVVLVVLVELDVTGDVERAGQARRRRPDVRTAREHVGRVAWNRSYAVDCVSKRSPGWRSRWRSSAGISSAGRNSVGNAWAHARATGSASPVRYRATRPENASTVARTEARA